MEKKKYLYFNDFSPTKEFTAGPVTITENDIIRYAKEFDPQFFHLDKNAAKESIFGTLIASGWHTASISMRLFTMACGNISGGMIGRSVEKIQWPRPTYPNDSLSLTSRVTDARPSKSRPDLGVIKTQNTTSNQHGKPVMIADIVMFVPIQLK